MAHVSTTVRHGGYSVTVGAAPAYTFLSEVIDEARTHSQAEYIFPANTSPANSFPLAVRQDQNVFDFIPQHYEEECHDLRIIFSLLRQLLLSMIKERMRRVTTTTSTTPIGISLVERVAALGLRCPYRRGNGNSNTSFTKHY